MVTWEAGIAAAVAVAVTTPIFIQWLCGWPRGATTITGNLLDAFALDTSIKWCACDTLT